jgi:hypothetical protein
MSPPLTELKRKTIHYLYEHGMHQPKRRVLIDDLRQAIGIESSEYKPLFLLLFNSGLVGTTGPVHISDRCRVQAAENATSPGVVIHANYSVVQVAGADSVQTAHAVIKEVTGILNEIEQQIPKLNIPPETKTHASALLNGLRQGIGTLSNAVISAIAGSLAGILTQAGSDLGERLLTALGIIAT